MVDDSENRPKAEARKVSFEAPPDEDETDKLLEDATSKKASEASDHDSSSYFGHGIVSHFSNPAYQAPEVVVTEPDKFDLDPLPSSFTSWPRYALRVACTNCGHYVSTRTLEETEWMGCTPCFTGGSVFKRSVNHYCPNCSEVIGVYYTGEDCFWCDDRGKESNLTCLKLVTTCCAAWRSS